MSKPGASLKLALADSGPQILYTEANFAALLRAPLPGTSREQRCAPLSHRKESICRTLNLIQPS